MIPSLRTIQAVKANLPLLPIFVLLGAFLGGCAAATKLDDIRIGMSKPEVLTILGKPDSMSAQGNIEYLTYYLVPDSQGFVSGNRSSDQPYLVRIVDGKVESFGRFAQLFDIYNRPVGGNAPGSPPINPMMQSYAVAQPAGTVAPAPGLADQLAKLKTLKDQGVLTDDEFQRAKQMLLSGQK